MFRKMSLKDLVTKTERELSKTTKSMPVQHVFEDYYNPLTYYLNLIECGIPKNLAKIETIQYEKHYNTIKRYFAIDIEMRSYKKPVYNKKKKRGKRK